MPRFSVDRPALDSERLAAHESRGDFSASRFDDPAESRTGYFHAKSGLLLVESFEVGKAQRLVLIECEDDLIEVPGGDARGLENRRRRSPRNTPAAAWPRHQDLQAYYEHMLIIVKPHNQEPIDRHRASPGRRVEAR